MRTLAYLCLPLTHKHRPHQRFPGQQPVSPWGRQRQWTFVSGLAPEQTGPLSLCPPVHWSPAVWSDRSSHGPWPIHEQPHKHVYYAYYACRHNHKIRRSAWKWVMARKRLLIITFNQDKKQITCTDFCLCILMVKHTSTNSSLFSLSMPR